jgi:hypothetical protein
VVRQLQVPPCNLLHVVLHLSEHLIQARHILHSFDAQRPEEIIHHVLDRQRGGAIWLVLGWEVVLQEADLSNVILEWDQDERHEDGEAL